MAWLSHIPLFGWFLLLSAIGGVAWFIYRWRQSIPAPRQRTEITPPPTTPERHTPPKTTQAAHNFHTSDSTDTTLKTVTLTDDPQSFTDLLPVLPLPQFSIEDILQPGHRKLVQSIASAQDLDAYEAAAAQLEELGDAADDPEWLLTRAHTHIQTHTFDQAAQCLHKLQTQHSQSRAAKDAVMLEMATEIEFGRPFVEAMKRLRIVRKPRTQPLALPSRTPPSLDLAVDSGVAAVAAELSTKAMKSTKRVAPEMAPEKEVQGPRLEAPPVEKVEKAIEPVGPDIAAQVDDVLQLLSLPPTAKRTKETRPSSHVETTLAKESLVEEKEKAAEVGITNEAAVAVMIEATPEESSKKSVLAPSLLQPLEEAHAPSTPAEPYAPPQPSTPVSPSLDDIMATLDLSFTSEDIASFNAPLEFTPPTYETTEDEVGELEEEEEDDDFGWLDDLELKEEPEPEATPGVLAWQEPTPEEHLETSLPPLAAPPKAPVLVAEEPEPAQEIELPLLAMTATTTLPKVSQPAGLASTVTTEAREPKVTEVAKAAEETEQETEQEETQEVVLASFEASSTPPTPGEALPIQETNIAPQVAVEPAPALPPDTNEEALEIEAALASLDFGFPDPTKDLPHAALRQPTPRMEPTLGGIKLAFASRLEQRIEEADRYREAGEHTQANELLEEIIEMAPGTRYAKDAQMRLMGDRIFSAVRGAGS